MLVFSSLIERGYTRGDRSERSSWSLQDSAGNGVKGQGQLVTWLLLDAWLQSGYGEAYFTLAPGQGRTCPSMRTGEVAERGNRNHPRSE